MKVLVTVLVLLATALSACEEERRTPTHEEVCEKSCLQKAECLEKVGGCASEDDCVGCCLERLDELKTNMIEQGYGSCWDEDLRAQECYASYDFDCELVTEDLRSRDCRDLVDELAECREDAQPDPSCSDWEYTNDGGPAWEPANCDD